MAEFQDLWDLWVTREPLGRLEARALQASEPVELPEKRGRLDGPARWELWVWLDLRDLQGRLENPALQEFQELMEVLLALQVTQERLVQQRVPQDRLDPEEQPVSLDFRDQEDHRELWGPLDSPALLERPERLEKVGRLAIPDRWVPPGLLESGEEQELVEVLEGLGDKLEPRVKAVVLRETPGQLDRQDVMDKQVPQGYGDTVSPALLGQQGVQGSRGLQDPKVCAILGLVLIQ